VGLTTTVNTVIELITAIESPMVTEVIIQTGKYVLPRGTAFSSIHNKRIFGEGLVQVIGPVIFSDSSRILLTNLSIRCPVDGRTVSDLASLDAVKAVNVSKFCISHCSIYGGADETVAITGDCSDCAIENSVIGACFHAGRNHEMALMVDCDGFILRNSMLLACDRRVPQISGNRLRANVNPSTVLNNLIETGHTMTLGLKPLSQSFQIDVVNNRFIRCKKTRCSEIEVVNGSDVVVEAYFRDNILADETEASINEVLNGEYLLTTSSPFTVSGYINSGFVPHVVGPTIRDSWDNVILERIGSGKIYQDETVLPSL